MKNKEFPLQVGNRLCPSLGRLMVTGILLWGCSIPAIALTVSGPGFTHLGGVTPSSITYGRGYWQYRTDIPPKGFNLMISTKTGNHFTNCTEDLVLPNILTTDRNYYGWELPPAGSGVYGVIYSSWATGRLWKSPTGGAAHYITATWAADGKASTNGTNNMANCYTSIQRGEHFAVNPDEESLSGHLNYGVYVDQTNPKAGNYTLSFYVGSYWGTFTVVTQNFDVNLTNCTVITPNKIQFGNVDAGSTTPVIAPDGGIEISCMGRPPTVNVAYTAQAVSAIQSQTELVMSNSQNQTLGTVRGFIGTNAESEAGCNDTATSVHFGAPAQSLLNAVTNNQAHTIPLKWVLCPVSSAPPGEGTASATLDIIWQ